MARSIEQYAAEVAPNQPFGYVDERGFVRFHGLGLKSSRSEPSGSKRQRAAPDRPRDGEPARGGEQAAFIWRRVLGPAIANGEPEP
jgi:hypothetical protein